ncbi:hypothetical protein ACSAZK_05190 [Methanosarcina sp. Mfa9]|uniref:hypothetical protein n=1 Tax=Methanosarcina sp. Mfa9 TaxID=3439063 RepID=UPI003F84F714
MPAKIQSQELFYPKKNPMLPNLTRREINNEKYGRRNVREGKMRRNGVEEKKLLKRKTANGPD